MNSSALTKFLHVVFPLHCPNLLLVTVAVHLRFLTSSEVEGLVELVLLVLSVGILVLDHAHYVVIVLSCKVIHEKGA